MGRLTPVTTFTAGASRARCIAAKKQDPQGMSTNTTAGAPSMAVVIRCSISWGPPPWLETATSTPACPLIRSASSTSAWASPPWATTTPRSPSLIIFLQIFAETLLVPHLLDEPLVERRRHIHSREPEQVHHRHYFRDDGDVLTGIERDDDAGNGDV